MKLPDTEATLGIHDIYGQDRGEGGAIRFQK